MKTLIRPFYKGEDAGDGGIRRVVEAQERYLPDYDIQVVRKIEEADLVAVHAGEDIRTDLPYVQHCHGLYWAEYDWNASWYTALNDLVIKSMLRADYVTAVSDWVRYAIARGSWIDSKVIYSGVNLEDWSVPKRSAEYILWNKTRIDPICDVEPVNELSKRLPDVNFASTFGDIRENVTVLGVMSYEMQKQHVHFANLYLATTRETFGIGTLEAMASGVPIVGWRWGGQQEFIVNGEHGYLATPGNYDELIYGIQKCMEDRERLSKNVRALVEEKFTWPSAIKGYADIYHKAYNERNQVRPKVSVVITNYKLEHMLASAVLSVIRQEGINPETVEIVIVDDASPSWNLAQELIDKLQQDESVKVSIRVIHNEKNLYLAGALNVGIANSKGEYIVCLDADNQLTPRCLYVLSTSLDMDRKIDIAYGAMAVEDGSTKEPWISSWPVDFTYSQQILHHNQIPSTCMYRRRVWERTGGYRIRCRTAEDADFWCRAASFGFLPKKVTDMPTFIYNDRQDSMSHVEPDWAWHNWYTWNRTEDLTPFAAVQQHKSVIRVPTYEPAKVSVVIPVGPGHEQIVIDAVDSLVAQTFTNWECIVVNDTGKKLPWIHPFVKVIDVEANRRQENSDNSKQEYFNRVSYARNRGIEAAKANYFVLLDADDYLQPTALKRMYEAIRNSENTIAHAYTDWYVAENKERHETPNYIPEHVFQKFTHAVTCIYKREAWKKVGGFDESLRGWEDWDFVIALRAAGYCGIRIPYPLLHYRINGGSRREELYANLEENKKEIHDKWHKYIEGEILVACGCQNKSGVAPSSADRANSSYTPNPDSDMVQVEYSGDIAGPLSYVGKVTNSTYRFGTDPEYRVKYVYKADLPALLSIDGFNYYDESNNEPVLEAAGPPEKVLVEA